ncbi:MAG TPA: FAD-dependent oxidoreductase [Anaerolineae bacterium]|nr:FAD-dependent oxidoreductase [Anaerolineae bacterium]
MMTEQPAHTKRVLIVGAGIAGMQAALDIANSGYEVVLVDRLPSVGGHMHQLSETFPTLDCAQCIMTPRTVDVGRHEKIKLHVYSEIEEVAGEVGDFRVRIRRKPAYVNWDLCTACGACSEKCPTSIPVAFDRHLEMPRVMKSG